MTAEVAAGSIPSTVIRAALGYEVAKQDEVQFSENIVGQLSLKLTLDSDCTRPGNVHFR